MKLLDNLCQVQGLCLLEMFARTEHLLLEVLPHTRILVTQRFVIILVEKIVESKVSKLIVIQQIALESQEYNNDKVNDFQIAL